MTLVSEAGPGYLTHLQEHHRYPAVNNLAKRETFEQLVGWVPNLSELTCLNSQ